MQLFQTLCYFIIYVLSYFLESFFQPKYHTSITIKSTVEPVYSGHLRIRYLSYPLVTGVSTIPILQEEEEKKSCILGILDSSYEHGT